LRMFNSFDLLKFISQGFALSSESTLSSYHSSVVKVLCKLLLAHLRARTCRAGPFWSGAIKNRCLSRKSVDTGFVIATIPTGRKLLWIAACCLADPAVLVKH
jgi:hypothetical protein